MIPTMKNTITQRVMFAEAATQGLSVHEMDGNPQVHTAQRPLLVKSEQALNQKRVLWLRDSFGTAMAPFMAVTFSETLQLHYDAANPELFARLVNSFKPDYVFITVVERGARRKRFGSLPPLISASGKPEILSQQP
jgi:hypothetical protein